jgi:thymidylate synthase
MLRTKDIRQLFIDKLTREEFVIDKSGVKTVELVGYSFVADEPSIFGEPNKDYEERELAWYKSMSLNVNDIPGGPPKIWQAVADGEGYINSNYGNLIWSERNCFQYDHVKEELKNNRDSRRGVMVYNRPSIWYEYNQNGRSDFICTNAVGFMIRDDKLQSIVQMRSNDAMFGFRNDRAWHVHVQNQLAQDLNIEVGDLIWNSMSLHFYERHFNQIH